MSNRLFMRRSVALCALVAVGAVVATASAAPRQSEVWFLRDGTLVSVSRAGHGPDAALRALLAGPTAAESARGLETAVPPGVPVRSLRVSRRVVTVDLGARFALGLERRALRDRVTQLVRTLRAVPGVAGVRIRIEGGVPVGLFPGYDLARTVTTPLEEVERPFATRDLQRLLVDLGFLGRVGITGALDAQTSAALLAFQKWAGLPRDGIATPATVDRLRRATRPRPSLFAPGRRIEVQLGRQLALLIRDGRVERTVHVSSGAGGLTPIGSFRVFRKERLSWSVPFKVWLPWASYFVGGVAFHEFGSVPTYAASHGCVRVNPYDAPMLYEFAELETRVDVFWEQAA